VFTVAEDLSSVPRRSFYNSPRLPGLVADGELTLHMKAGSIDCGRVAQTVESRAHERMRTMCDGRGNVGWQSAPS